MSRISQAIAMAHANADIALIVNDADGGKTTAAHWYAERNSRSAILIDVVKGMNSRALLNEMACQLGEDSFRVNQTALMQSVADALEFSRRLVYDLGRSGLVLIEPLRLVYAIQNLIIERCQDVMAANGLEAVTAKVVATAASCVMKRRG
jgi:hypothetical protein